MTTSNLTSLLEKANQAKDQYDFSGAIQYYTTFLEESAAASADAAMLEMRLVALRQRALLQRRTGDQQAAMTSYRQYRQEARTPQQTAVGIELVGQQHNNMGHHERAMELHREALQVAELNNYTYGRALAFQGMGANLFYLGRFEAAISVVEKSLSLFRQLNDAEEISRSWNLLGVIYQRQGKTDKCIHAFAKSLEKTRAVGELETAVVLNNLGESYQQLFCLEQALTYHQEALELAEKVNLPLMAIDIQRNLGVVLTYLGQADTGIDHLRQSLRLSEEVGRPFIIFQALYSISLAEQMRGNNRQAEAYAQELLKQAVQNKARDFQAQAYYALGLCAQTDKDVVKAELWWQQALFLAHETGQQTLLWQLHAALAEISPPALSQTHYRIAAEVIDQIIYPVEDKALRQTFLSASPIKRILDHIGT